MRYNKQAVAWTLLALVFIVAFSFSDNYVSAADNSTNISNTTVADTGNDSTIKTSLLIFLAKFLWLKKKSQTAS